ncbi:MAG: Uma2 family endonuclease [Planctomycetota bacterium]
MVSTTLNKVGDERRTTPRKPIRGEPVWELDDPSLPLQGDWTPELFLKLDMNGTELVDGCLEFKPMANEPHNDILFYVFTLIHNLIRPKKIGKGSFATLKVKTVGKNRREPDTVVVMAENYDRFRQRSSWLGADFIVEIVSQDDPKRDYDDKRVEYAAAGIGEYWIIDPLENHVVVLRLGEGATAYRQVGVFRDEEPFDSSTVPGLRLTPNQVSAPVQDD